MGLDDGRRVAGKAEDCEIQFVNKRIGDVGRILLLDVIVQSIRKQCNLVTFCGLDKACNYGLPVEIKSKTKSIISKLYC